MERWSHFQTETEVFIWRLDQSCDNFTIWLSDFKALWNETVTNSDLIKRFSDKNPTLATDDEEIKGQLFGALGIVTSIKDATVRNKPNSDDVELQLKYIIFGDVEVKLEWLLKKCGALEFFDQITKSMLRQLSELQDQKTELCALAKKKDQEIGQYKLELKDKQIRKRFITERFEEEKFTLQSQMFNCEIDQFQRVIGLLPKKVVSEEEPKVHVECNTAEQPIKKTSVVKHANARSKRNQIRLKCPELIRPGVRYENSSDDDNDVNKNDVELSSKRTRSSSDF